MAEVLHEKDEVVSALKIIDDLIDESVQNYELDKEKSNVIDELINSLKIISRYVKISVQVSPSLLNLKPDTKIIITPNLELMIIDAKNNCKIKEFNELTLDELTTILSHYLPTLTNTVKEERESKNKKIIHLRDASKKLQNINKIKLGSIVEKTTPTEQSDNKNE